MCRMKHQYLPDLFPFPLWQLRLPGLLPLRQFPLRGPFPLWQFRLRGPFPFPLWRLRLRGLFPFPLQQFHLPGKSEQSGRMLSGRRYPNRCLLNGRTAFRRQIPADSPVTGITACFPPQQLHPALPKPFLNR